MSLHCYSHLHVTGVCTHISMSLRSLLTSLCHCLHCSHLHVTAFCTHNSISLQSSSHLHVTAFCTHISMSLRSVLTSPCHCTLYSHLHVTAFLLTSPFHCVLYSQKKSIIKQKLSSKKNEFFGPIIFSPCSNNYCSS